MFNSNIDIPLNGDTALAFAKRVLLPIHCRWGTCSCWLNCWDVYDQHIQDHCRISKDICLYNNCLYQSRGLDDLLIHVDWTHLRRFDLPCPMNCCPESFNRHILLCKHFHVAHDVAVDLEGITLNRPNAIVRRTVQPFPIRRPTERARDINVKEVLPYKLYSREVRPFSGALHNALQSILPLSSSQQREESMDGDVNTLSDFAKLPISFYDEIEGTIIQPCMSERHSDFTTWRSPLNSPLLKDIVQFRTGFSGFAMRLAANT